MLRNYFKTAFRTLVRHLNYTIINVAGLTVGIAVCMMIFVIIQYQTSFDTYHSNRNRVYRVLTEHRSTDAANIPYSKDVPFPLPNALKTSFPQIEKVAPIFASSNDQILVTDENGKTLQQFIEPKGVFFTEPSFFELFDFPLLAGTYTSLQEPNNVLLSKATAEKYFGDWHLALNKTIKIQAGGYVFEHGTEVLKVSGILENPPANTDFQFKALVAYGTGFTGSLMNKSIDWNDRTNQGFSCFVRLPEQTAASGINQELANYATKVQSADNKDVYQLQALADVHYDTQAGNFSNTAISKQLINVLWVIAAFILLIACVNFINLSTAQAVNRAKEVGVRKVLGSNKTQLQIQFIVETFLVVLFAVVLAIILTVLTLPYINQLLNLSLSLQIVDRVQTLLFLLAITIGVTVLAGFYAALVLSRFNPIEALKSRFKVNSGKGLSLRRGLVVFQFIIAQALIIGTLVIVKQMNFFMNAPLGFQKEAVVNIPFRVDSLRISRLDYLRGKLMSIKGVEGVSFSSNTPVEDGADNWTSFRFNNATKESDYKVITKFTDDQYLSTYHLQLVAGRNLKPSGYTQEFVVNESFVRSLGIKNPEEILRKKVSIWNGLINCEVVGVVKDFNNRSFRDQVAPLVMTTNNTMYNQAGIQLTATNIPATLAAIKALFSETIPDFVFEYKFLDEKVDGFYRSEMQLAQLYQLFAIIAIFLSCLSLYGLASFMAAQRVKEVGIRKVLGASTGNIIYLFTKEFILLIAIAFAIATPLAWYYMHQWLQDYAYRIEIVWWLPLIGGIGALVIALLTISFQAVKAAVAKPVKSLRTE